MEVEIGGENDSLDIVVINHGDHGILKRVDGDGRIVQLVCVKRKWFVHIMEGEPNRQAFLPYGGAYLRPC
jgi:hypothetical protein